MLKRPKKQTTKSPYGKDTRLTHKDPLDQAHEDEEQQGKDGRIIEVQKKLIKYGDSAGPEVGVLPRTYLSEDEERCISEDCLIRQYIEAAMINRENKKLPQPTIKYTPSARLTRLFEATVVPGIKKIDKTLFGGGEFHGIDEQSAKTKELQEYKVAPPKGLDNPKDPGYDPAIFYSHLAGKEKEPIYTMTVIRKKPTIGGGVDDDDCGGNDNHNSDNNNDTSGNNTNDNDTSTGNNTKTTVVVTERQFNLFNLTWDQVGLDWTIVLIGKRRSGKTVFLKSLLGNRLRPHFPRVYVFTNSYFSGEYKDFVPYEHIYPGFHEPIEKNSSVLGIDVLASIIETQKVYNEAVMAGKCNLNTRVLLILDDVLSDGLRYKKLIDVLFYNGRHLNICIAITSQDTKGINPACTGNTDMATFFRVRSERDKEALRTKFADFFKNDEEFEGLTAMALRRKWHSVSVFQDQPHIDSEFTMFCGRPTMPCPFVLGCSSWWRESEEQLKAIVAQHPQELGHLLTEPDNWGVVGEEEFNQFMSHIPRARR